MKLNKPLTRDQLHSIRSIWMQNFHRKSIESMEQAWFSVITDFLIYEGTDLVPEEVRLLEASVIDKGLSEDYVNTLIEITNLGVATSEDDLDQNDKLVVMLSASPEERLKALKFVLSI